MHNGMTFEEAITRPVRHFRYYEYEGQMQTLRQISIKSGVSYGALRDRLDSGMTIDEALSAEKFKHRRKTGN